MGSPLGTDGQTHTTENITLWWHDRSWSRAPPMIVCKYMDRNSLAAILPPKKSAGVAPVVNWGFHCMQVRMHTTERIHPGFGIQGRNHQNSKTGVSVVLQKGIKVLQKKINKKIAIDYYIYCIHLLLPVAVPSLAPLCNHPFLVIFDTFFHNLIFFKSTDFFSPFSNL